MNFHVRSPALAAILLACAAVAGGVSALGAPVAAQSATMVHIANFTFSPPALAVSSPWQSAPYRARLCNSLPAVSGFYRSAGPSRP